ncbi:hypothetical protein D3C87_226600 [compost metagenome]
MSFDKKYEQTIKIYSKVITETQFIQYTTPFEEIERNFKNFEHTETQFKKEIRDLIALPIAVKVAQEIKDKLEKYISKEKFYYFGGNSYNDDELDILFHAVNAFQDALHIVYFETKKELLKEMETLQLNSKQVLA